MEWVETTGRTVEEAKEAALDQLGVDETDAEFEIVEEPRFGLFGRLRSEARVRARVRPTKPRAKEERRDRRGRRKVGADSGPPAGEDERSDADSSVSDGVTAAPRAPGARATAATAAAVSVGTDDRAADEGDSAAARRNRRGRGGAGAPASTGAMSPAGTRGPDRERRPEPRPRQNSNNDDTMSPGGGMDVALDEQGAVAKEFLDGLIERMSLDAKIGIALPEEDTIELNLEGPDLGLLIGPKGATLLAIQDLTRTVVQRKTSAGNGRILVDVGGYRRKRKEALARFSRQVAAEVTSTGTRRVLEPMSAADRKVVHDTLNDIEGVMTSSEGEDPRRRVVIHPLSVSTGATGPVRTGGMEDAGSPEGAASAGSADGADPVHAADPADAARGGHQAEPVPVAESESEPGEDPNG